jgi:hypothetical protein
VGELIIEVDNKGWLNRGYHNFGPSNANGCCKDEQE